MNHPMQKATQAYQAHTKETLSPRSVEYRVFGQVISRMEIAKEKQNDILALEEALNDNILLWNALSADVMDDHNALPDQLRAQIVYLAQYMHHHTALVRKQEADLTPMIDINRMIMEGLAPAPISQTSLKETIGE